jgi:hypothetical protein
VLLYGIETWPLKNRDWNRIQAAEMKYLRAAKVCNRADQLRNEDTCKQLGIFPLHENITEYKYNWKIHLQRMEQTRIPLQPIKISSAL